MVSRPFTPPTETDIAQLLSSVNLDDGIDAIVTQLEDRYPWHFRASLLSSESYRPNIALYDQKGDRVTDRVEAWIEAEVKECGGMKEAIEKWRPEKLMRTKNQFEPYLITAQVSPAQEDLLLIKLAIGQEQPWRIFGTGHFGTPFMDDLLDGNCENPVEGAALGEKKLDIRSIDYLPMLVEHVYLTEIERRQDFVRKNNVTVQDTKTGQAVTKGILEVYPDYLDYRLPIQRFITDWTEIAGDKKLADFFDFDIKQWTPPNTDAKCYQFIPRPVGLQELPRCEETDDLWQVMQQGEQLDQAAGYKHAWYFHALYGNRISSDAIRTVGEGLLDKKIDLEPALKGAIKRWMEDSYSF